MIPRGRRLLRHPPVARFIALLALLTTFALLLVVVPRPELAALSNLVDALGPAAPLAAIVIGALLLVVLIPRTFVTLAWGALFGLVPGALYMLAAAGLAALIGFALGRILGREFVAGRIRGRLARLDGWFTRQGVLGVITVRLLPVSGFGLVSYGYGTTGARLGPYLAGSVLASVPTVFGYAALGAAVVAPEGVNWLVVTPAALGLVASAVVLHRWWRTERTRAS
jgi:uncharacterized membrane protein YdjX (TVP38/TMEM64 family)